MVNLTLKGYLFVAVAPLLMVLVALAGASLAFEGARAIGVERAVAYAIAAIVWLAIVAVIRKFLIRLMRSAARMAHQEFYKTFD